jgi:hypothetical protein
VVVELTYFGFILTSFPFVDVELIGKGRLKDLFGRQQSQGGGDYNNGRDRQQHFSIHTYHNNNWHRTVQNPQLRSKEPPLNLPYWSSLKLRWPKQFVSSDQQKLLHDFDSLRHQMASGWLNES